MAFVDAYNFKGAGYYRGEGPAYVLLTHPEELARFLSALKEEYQDVLQKARNEGN